jgi:hypothetical protein
MRAQLAGSVTALAVLSRNWPARSLFMAGQNSLEVRVIRQRGLTGCDARSKLVGVVAFCGQTNRGGGPNTGAFGLTLANLSGRRVRPWHYDIDFSRIVPKRVSHLQIQLLPRIDAQLGMTEAIVDYNPKRTIREASRSSVLEKSREQFLSPGERGHPNVKGQVPISPAEASRGRCSISVHKKNVIGFDCNQAHRYCHFGFGSSDSATAKLIRCSRQSASMVPVVCRTAGYEHVLNWHKTESSLSSTILTGPKTRLYRPKS